MVRIRQKLMADKYQMADRTHDPQIRKLISSILFQCSDYAIQRYCILCVIFCYILARIVWIADSGPFIECIGWSAAHISKKIPNLKIIFRHNSTSFYPMLTIFLFYFFIFLFLKNFC